MKRKREEEKSCFNFDKIGFINPMAFVILAFIIAAIIAVPVSLISKNKEEITKPNETIKKIEILKNGEKSNIFLIDNGNDTYKIIEID